MNSPATVLADIRAEQSREAAAEHMKDRRAYRSDTDRIIDSARALRNLDPDDAVAILNALSCAFAQHLVIDDKAKAIAVEALDICSDDLREAARDKRSPEEQKADRWRAHREEQEWS